MKKIYKLKKWYSIEDAADRLSLTLSESVSVKDVLEFVLEGHVELYWFMRHVPAIEVELQKQELPFLSEASRTRALRQVGIDPEDSDIKTFTVEDFFPVNPNGRVSYLQGPHHLRLHECGALSDYLRSFLTSTGGELISLDGFHVQDDQGAIWSIREPFEKSFLRSEENWNEKKFGPYHPMHTLNYFPSGKWPEFSELGFTKLALENFEKSIQGKEPNEISRLEHKALLKLILGMAMEQYGHNPSALRNEATINIVNDLREAGFPMGEDTVRKYLKIAKNVLIDGLEE